MMYRFNRLVSVGKSSFNFGRPPLRLRISREYCTSTGMGSSKLNQGPELDKKDDADEHAESRSVAANDAWRAFRELGVLRDVSQTLMEKSIERPTTIQSAAIPLILRYKDVVVRAKTGSGKTFAYLISMVEEFNRLADPDNPPPADIIPKAIIILPTLELCQHTVDQFEPFLKDFKLDFEVTLLKPSSEQDALLPRSCRIVVSTPDCLLPCLSKQYLKTKSPSRALQLLILDEVDLLLSNGFEDDLKTIFVHVPQYCQCLLFSCNPSADVEQLKSFAIDNPYIVTLPEVGDVKVEILPYNVAQFYIICKSCDKLLHFVYLLENKRIRDKVVIFTNSKPTSRRLKQYIQEYGSRLTAAVVDPYTRHPEIFEDFNAGRINQLIIVTPEHGLNWVSDVVGKINLDNVDMVVNFDMPQTAAGYAVRVDRTGRTHKIGNALSLVSPEEMGIFEEIKGGLGDEKGSKIIAPYPWMPKDAAEGYRAKFELFSEVMKLEAQGLGTVHLFPKMLEVCGVVL